MPKTQRKTTHSFSITPLTAARIKEMAKLHGCSKSMIVHLAIGDLYRSLDLVQEKPNA